MDEDFKNFMSLVNIYTQRLTLGNSVYNLVTNLEEEILIYEYNKIELSNELKALCGFIEKDEDIENKRYTLPIYIGKENALRVFKWLYYIGFISIFIGILIRALPVVSIVTLLVLKVVQGNINKFNKLQTKKDTFILAVKNFVITNLVYVITILCGLILDLY